MNLSGLTLIYNRGDGGANVCAGREPDVSNSAHQDSCSETAASKERYLKIYLAEYMHMLTSLAVRFVGLKFAVEFRWNLSYTRVANIGNVRQGFG